MNEPTNEELGIKPYTGWRIALAYALAVAISCLLWFAIIVTVTKVAAAIGLLQLK